MMGCGKTRVGRALAHRIGWRFFDLDAVIEAREKRTVATLFAEEGERMFRRRETRMLARLLMRPPSVIATGGGAFLALLNRQLIARSGISVYLATQPQILWRRIAGDAARPLIAGDAGRSRFAELMKTRRPLYALATLTVQARGADRPAALVDRICRELGPSDP